MKAALLAFCIIGLFVATPGNALSLRLPLDGLYRPGRYIPVEIDGAADSLTVDGDGVMSTAVEGNHLGRMTAPILCVGRSVGTLKINGGPPANVSCRALENDESLVGVCGGGVADRLAQAIFPGTKTIVIHLDATNPLPGPAIAWQSLDAVVISDPWPGGIVVEKLPQLLAGGMVVAVTGERAPDSRLPWLPVAGGWVLRPNIAGPLGCNGDADAYAPSATWHPDLPGDVRLRVLVVGGGAALLVLGASVLRGPWRYLAFAAVGLLAVLLTPGNRQRVRARGDILVTRAGWEQRDRWSYFADRGGRRIDLPLDEETWPVFIDAAQAKRLQCTLHQGPSSETLSFSLPPDNRLAIVSRLIRPATDADGFGIADPFSPMSRLARSLYRNAGTPHAMVAVPLTDGLGSESSNPVWPTVRCN